MKYNHSSIKFSRKKLNRYIKFISTFTYTWLKKEYITDFLIIKVKYPDKTNVSRPSSFLVFPPQNSAKDFGFQ
ncbi:hypothetical protein HMPREF9447_03007 [Bacteroides oleiciplenus YIT 12058]|uniref:Uncharacterized protein n=1 Tax=Bacteroides oleiciplenus YIT 12058 TaxID=742727 RepID=K9DX39_9BACE|nr:hypothetical protein HMPREF9447_03007 [Bacteroides oleiciplenus YIT 12058]